MTLNEAFVVLLNIIYYSKINRFNLILRLKLVARNFE